MQFTRVISDVIRHFDVLVDSHLTPFFFHFYREDIERSGVGLRKVFGFEQVLDDCRVIAERQLISDPFSESEN